jgi:hypothetical protein
MAHPIVHNTPQNIVKAVELTASGQTHAQVAKVLHCSISSVKRMLSDPLVKQALTDLRLALRVQALQGAQAIVPAAQAWLAEVVKGKTSAKDADALSRALLNLEKVAASASGENRQAAQSAQQIKIAVMPGWGAPKGSPKAPMPPGFQIVELDDPSQGTQPPKPALPALPGPDQPAD